MSSGTKDKVKGRVKEAAGALTGDKKLKNEGKADQRDRWCEERCREGFGQGQGVDRRPLEHAVESRRRAMQGIWTRRGTWMAAVL